uniref:Helicase C-terminal domain-containing protein n=1 Tax=Phytophthora ramorum TaxID=164328 RepID=H3G7S2_PHYRM
MSQFQVCPAACVLALPFKVGANGLNIVEATEVILVEPLLSNSIEAQAVNRVHRLGQTRRTRVHRFIVQGSIEERI